MWVLLSSLCSELLCPKDHLVLSLSLLKHILFWPHSGVYFWGSLICSRQFSFIFRNHTQHQLHLETLLTSLPWVISSIQPLPEFSSNAGKFKFTVYSSRTTPDLLFFTLSWKSQENIPLLKYKLLQESLNRYSQSEWKYNNHLWMKKQRIKKTKSFSDTARAEEQAFNKLQNYTALQPWTR